jgi:uncharacterized protein YbaP (TraB family)
MANRVMEMIEAGGTYFVVAGSAHFIGEKNVIEIVEKRLNEE